jgi:hypothetical protein
MQGIFPASGAFRLGDGLARADSFASFSVFGDVSRQKMQGIFGRAAGNLESPCREFLLAQQARPERKVLA